MKNPAWKNTALKKQLAFKKELGLTASGIHNKKYYDHILADEDANKGAAFYCYHDTKEWNNLKSWADKYRGKKVNFLNNGLKNILRSEHIAYNVFYPLEKQRQANASSLNKLIQAIVNLPVDSVDSIRVEFAGIKHKSEYLDDYTSFDTFIEFTSNQEKCALGIEIKYTEKSYPYTAKEKKWLYEEQSEYIQLANRSGYFNDAFSQSLKTKKLKQPFRNHLLGIKMEELGEVQKFYSVHFYPTGNTYQAEVVKSYKEELKEEKQDTFIELTFENFIQKAKAAGINDKWLSYFEKRY